MTGKPVSEENNGEGTAPAGLRGLVGWQRWQDVLRGALMAAFTASVLAVLFWQVEPAAIAVAAGRLTGGAWVAVLCLALALPLLAITRWWIMTRAQGAPQPWGLLLRAWLGISPVNLISPSKSGDLLRILALRGRMTGSRVLAGLLVERMLDLAILASFALAGGILSGRTAFMGISFAIFFAIFAAILIILSGARIPLGKTLTPKFALLSAALHEGLGKPGLLAAATALTAFHWTLVGVLVTVLLVGSGADVAAVDTLTAMPSAILAGMLPVTIAGMGTRDGAMLILYAGTADPSQILAAGLLYTSLVYGLPALVGLAFTRSVFHFQPRAASPPHPSGPENTKSLPLGALDYDYHIGRRNKRSFRYRLRRRTYEVARVLKRHLPVPPAVVVDVGTADGLMLSGLAETLGPGPTLIGCDISLPLLTAVKDQRLHKALADCTQLPFVDDFADAVVAAAIIEHVDDPGALVREARRILRPGGILIVTTPVPVMDHIASALGLLRETGHQFHFKLSELILLGEAHDMETLEARKFMFSPIGFPAELAIERLFGPLGLSFVMANQLCVLRKPEQAGPEAPNGRREGARSS